MAAIRTRAPRSRDASAGVTAAATATCRRSWAGALGATPVGTDLSPPAVLSSVSGARASRDAYRHDGVGQDDNAWPLDGCGIDGWLVRAGRRRQRRTSGERLPR